MGLSAPYDTVPLPAEPCPQCGAEPWSAHRPGCYWLTVWGSPKRSSVFRRIDWPVVLAATVGFGLGVLVGIVYTVTVGS